MSWHHGVPYALSEFSMLSMTVSNLAPVPHTLSEPVLHCSPFMHDQYRSRALKEGSVCVYRLYVHV